MRRSLFLLSSCVALLGCSHASTIDFRVKVDQAPWTFGFAPLAASPFWDPLDVPSGTTWGAQWSTPALQAYLSAEPARRGVTTVTGNGTRGPYVLKHRNVLPGSVVVRTGGVVELGLGADYTVEGPDGTLTFTRALPVGSDVSVTYDYRVDPGRWLFGAGTGGPVDGGGSWRAGVTSDLSRVNVSGGYRWVPTEPGQWSVDAYGGFGVQPDVLRSFHAGFSTASRWAWGDTRLEFTARRPDYLTFFGDGTAEQVRAAGVARWLVGAGRRVQLRVVNDARVTTTETDRVERRLQEYAVDYQFSVPQIGAAEVGVFRRLDETASVKAGVRADHRTGASVTVTGVGPVQGWRFGIDGARRDDRSAVYGANVGWVANLDDAWSGEALVRAEGTVGTTTADAFLLRVQPNVTYRTSGAGVAGVGGQFDHVVRGAQRVTKGSMTVRYADADVQASLTRAFPSEESVGGWAALLGVDRGPWRASWSSTWAGEIQNHSLRLGTRFRNVEPYVLGVYSVAADDSVSWEAGARWGALVGEPLVTEGWLGSARVYGFSSSISGALEYGYGWSATEQIVVGVNVASSGHFGVRASGTVNFGTFRVQAVASGHP